MQIEMSLPVHLLVLHILEERFKLFEEYLFVELFSCIQFVKISLKDNWQYWKIN